MKIVFMGTPAFAVPSLNMLLAEGYSVVAVVTQPDRPQGRKKVLTPTPVKEAALAHGIPVLQPQRLRSPEAVAELARYEPDMIITAAYGQILPKEVLELPRLGCLNVHGSLLPKYRGGAPIQRCIINGETVTGITLMYMAEGLDTGDMIAKREVQILEQDTAGTLFEKLSQAGAELLKEQLPSLSAGKVQAEPQNEEDATYAPNLKREDEKIDWSRSALDIFNQIRGLVPFSGAFTLWDEAVFKVWSARVEAEEGRAGDVEPGTVLKLDDRGIQVQTGRGVLSLETVQPSGKKAMEAAQFIRGTSLVPGTVLR
ncbi:methionyl-tRNA formyltransferase [Paenibacillus sp. F411]|uniref:Methionyl-tRNA formyltransferase n=1 Tax=Paenibacillus algicola TaxID=2565926 RepID=A0A4P8XIF1_9BACL|nr:MULTISPECIES: methionyl-tRNA formyltransferase [Paenibacillus]MBO2944971.1 methionyl-tRNA formyltransferase [Paenibacillus sp. F411]QCT02366.1 methionyl-tRNA formyltransferase [Paenibacillus algicola]